MSNIGVKDRDPGSRIQVLIRYDLRILEYSDTRNSPTSNLENVYVIYIIDNIYWLTYELVVKLYLQILWNLVLYKYLWFQSNVWHGGFRFLSMDDDTVTHKSPGQISFESLHRSPEQRCNNNTNDVGLGYIIGKNDELSGCKMNRGSGKSSKTAFQMPALCHNELT